MISIPADLVGIVAVSDEERRDLGEAVQSCEVQTGVAFVGEIGILKKARVVADNALDEEDVVEENGSPQASGRIDPGRVLVGSEMCFKTTRTLPHVISGVGIV